MRADEARAEMCRIEMNWGPCNYTLKRSQRRSVGFQIGENGLQVSAPSRLSATELNRIILSKSAWIQQRLRQWETRSRQTVKLGSLLNENRAIPVRGEAYALQETPAGTKALLNPWSQLIALPACDHPDQRLKTLEKLLKAHAREVFTQVACRLADRSRDAVALPAFSIHLSSPAARWGSCNSRREVRLNWRLVHYPPRLIEYVIAHELAHLVEMNHSARFWAVVESLMPDYREPHALLSGMNPSEVPVS